MYCPKYANVPPIFDIQVMMHIVRVLNNKDYFIYLLQPCVIKPYPAIYMLTTAGSRSMPVQDDIGLYTHICGHHAYAYNMIIQVIYDISVATIKCNKKTNPTK